MTGPAAARWPPPGADRLLGRAWRQAFALGATAVVAVTPLLGSDTPSGVPPVGTALWWTTLAGLALHAAAGTLALLTARGLLRLGRQGVPAGLGAEVAADWRGDTGALRDGVGPYADVAPAVRRQARRARVVAAALANLAASALPVMALVGLRLRADGAIGPVGFVLALLTPSLALLFMLPASRALSVPRGAVVDGTPATGGGDAGPAAVPALAALGPLAQGVTAWAVAPALALQVLAAASASLPTTM